MSVTVKAALMELVVAGVKVTVKVHKAPAAKLLPQLLDSAKYDGFVPVMSMLEILNVPVPVLVKVTV